MTSPRKLIPETGRLLIVLARAGQVLTAVSVLGVAWVLFRIALPALPNDQGAVDVLRNAFSESSMAFVNGWYLLRASIYIWALERIRQIGTALLRFEPISTEVAEAVRSEEHTSELQSLMRISYAVFCLKKKKHKI